MWVATTIETLAESVNVGSCSSKGLLPPDELKFLCDDYSRVDLDCTRNYSATAPNFLSGLMLN